MVNNGLISNRTAEWRRTGMTTRSSGCSGMKGGTSCTSKSDKRLLDYELGSNLDITH